MKSHSFCRQSNGHYVSPNGLTVTFKKISSWLYANVYLSNDMKVIVKRFNNPVKGVNAILNWCENLGKMVDFTQIHSSEDIAGLNSKQLEVIRDFISKDGSVHRD